MTETKIAPKSLHSAGDEIDAWCTRCKMDLAHRIVAMVGSAPKRVMCMTCDSEHNYRAPKSAAAAKAPRVATKKKATTKKAVSDAREEWRSQVESGAPFTSYTISVTFQDGQLVRHKKFGEGYVVSTVIGKVVIAFADGEKTLVQSVQD